MGNYVYSDNQYNCSYKPIYNCPLFGSCVVERTPTSVIIPPELEHIFYRLRNDKLRNDKLRDDKLIEQPN